MYKVIKENKIYLIEKKTKITGLVNNACVYSHVSVMKSSPIMPYTPYNDPVTG